MYISEPKPKNETLIGLVLSRAYLETYRCK